MSAEGAAVIRRKLKKYLMDGDERRERFRPATGMW
jgi:hypothetical protein